MELTLRHALSASKRCCLAVKESDGPDFFQVRFVGAARAKDAHSSTPFSRGAGDTVGAQDALEALGDARLKSEKIRHILPKLGKESVDLLDLVDSVAVYRFFELLGNFVQGRLVFCLSKFLQQYENCEFDATNLTGI